MVCSSASFWSSKQCSALNASTACGSLISTFCSAFKLAYSSQFCRIFSTRRYSPKSLAKAFLSDSFSMLAGSGKRCSNSLTTSIKPRRASPVNTSVKPSIYSLQLFSSTTFLVFLSPNKVMASMVAFSKSRNVTILPKVLLAS